MIVKTANFVAKKWSIVAETYEKMYDELNESLNSFNQDKFRGIQKVYRTGSRIIDQVYKSMIDPLSVNQYKVESILDGKQSKNWKARSNELMDYLSKKKVSYTDKNVLLNAIDKKKYLKQKRKQDYVLLQNYILNL